MTDILEAVNDFVIKYCKTDDIPALEQRQVVRGWQNLVSALPPNSREYVVLTLLASTRHGTNVHEYKHSQGDSGLDMKVSGHYEHLVQVDFCCSYPDQNEERARTRANILEMLTRDSIAVDFYRDYGLSCCYADDVHPMSFLDSETKQWVARYVVTIHLEGWVSSEPKIDSFSSLKLYLENVDVHHPVLKPKGE